MKEPQHWISVTSSNIHSIAYNEQDKILFVKFLHGGIYSYFDVPSHIFNQILVAESIGKYFSQNIKGIFRAEKIA